ncbi:MAG TPA: hypothetical protein VHZ24_07875 [Pirellulales bacterium]|nr:hypothetical protein [Pirellulales bacterium]
MIRERGFADIMDLALRLIRGHALPLGLCWLVGAVPCALLNYALLWGALAEADLEVQVPWQYLGHLAVLMIWQTPLATATMTLYLGQALFLEKPSVGLIARQFVSRLPQLFWLQVVVRGLIAFWFIYGYRNGYSSEAQTVLAIFVVIGWWMLYMLWPYSNEVLLLERNPLRRAPGQITTLRRITSMHAHAASEVTLRWMIATLVGWLLLTALIVAWWNLVALATFSAWPRADFYAVYVPVAAWGTIGYFTVVRFLSYVDLRIRNEGWEVELTLRTEGARIARQLS